MKEIVLTAIEQMEFPRQGGGVQTKAVLTLQGWPAQLVLNKTNFEVLAAAYGRQAAGWLGKPIEVYPDTTFFSGRLVPCVRVRVPRPAAPMAAVPGMAPAAPAASRMAVPNAAPAQAPTGQAEQLPPLMTAGEMTDDIPY